MQWTERGSTLLSRLLGWISKFTVWDQLIPHVRADVILLKLKSVMLL